MFPSGRAFWRLATARGRRTARSVGPAAVVGPLTASSASAPQVKGDRETEHQPTQRRFTTTRARASRRSHAKLAKRRAARAGRRPSISAHLVTLAPDGLADAQERGQDHDEHPEESACPGGEALRRELPACAGQAEEACCGCARRGRGEVQRGGCERREGRRWDARKR